MKKGEMKTNLYYVFIPLVIVLAASAIYPQADSIYTKVNSDSLIHTPSHLTVLHL